MRRTVIWKANKWADYNKEPKHFMRIQSCVFTRTHLAMIISAIDHWRAVIQCECRWWISG
jgi:hypothetical protein